MKNLNKFILFVVLGFSTASLFSAAIPFEWSKAGSQNNAFLAPELIDSELSSNGVYGCVSGSVGASLKSSSGWSSEKGVSLFGTDRTEAEPNASDRISNLQELKDRSQLVSALTCAIILLQGHSEEKTMSPMLLSSTVNKKLSFYNFGYEICTPLHLAILELNVEFVAKLIELGAKVNAKFRATENASEALRACNCALDLANLVGNSEIIKLLRESGALSSCAPTPIKLFLSTGSSCQPSFRSQFSKNSASLETVVDSPFNRSGEYASICGVVNDTGSIGFDSLAPSESSVSREHGIPLAADPMPICFINIPQLETFDPNAVLECDSNPISMLKDVLKNIENLENNVDTKNYLEMIIGQIKRCDESFKSQLAEIINKRFSVYGLGYQMCSLLHLLIIYLPDAVPFFVDYGAADVTAEFRLVPLDLAPSCLEKLCDCQNALDLAVCLQALDVAEFLASRGARNTEYFKAAFGRLCVEQKADKTEVKKKCHCSIV